MAFIPIVDNFTPQQIAELGGKDGVFQYLYDRAWSNLAITRDGREWVVRFSQQEPQQMANDPQERRTFAVHCNIWLANPRDAEIGETVHVNCMPQTAMIPDSDPPKAEILGRSFVRTDNGWDRLE